MVECLSSPSVFTYKVHPSQVNLPAKVLCSGWHLDNAQRTGEGQGAEEVVEWVSCSRGLAETTSWSFGQAAGGIRDFSPWIRDPTCAPAVEVQSLNYWTDKEVPQHLLPFQEVFWMLSCNVSAYISFAISSFKEGWKIEYFQVGTLINQISQNSSTKEETGRHWLVDSLYHISTVIFKRNRMALQ